MVIAALFALQIAAGGGTPFVAYLDTCTDKRPPKPESVPGMVGATMERCVVKTLNEKPTAHAHSVRLRAITADGKVACEVSTTIQANTPPRVVAAFEAVYPSQLPETTKVLPGIYRIQVCRSEVVPPGEAAEDKQSEYCSALGSLRVRPGADSAHCARANH